MNIIFIFLFRHTDYIDTSVINEHQQIILTNWNRNDCMCTYCFQIKLYLIILSFNLWFPPLLCSTYPFLWSPKEVAAGAGTQTAGVLPSTQRPWPQHSGRQPSGGELSQKARHCSRWGYKLISLSHTHWHTLTASQGEQLTLNSPEASQASRETVTLVSSRGIYVCI